jgi:hypothetical protein
MKSRTASARRTNGNPRVIPDSTGEVHDSIDSRPRIATVDFLQLGLAATNSRRIDEAFMKTFEKGSKVKLTDRYAKTLAKARGNPNWVGRLGTVIHCNRFSVSILWEGRMSADHVPHKAVELALHPCSEFICLYPIRLSALDRPT